MIKDVRNQVDDSILIDMINFQDRVLDLESNTITLGAGNRWQDVFKWLYEAQQTLVPVTGAEPDVSPTGWSIGGGHGYLNRLYGYGADQIVSLRAILADGQKVEASTNSYPELFRALRGSGGSTFGIVTSLSLKAHDDPDPTTVYTGIYVTTLEHAELIQE